MTFTVPRSGCKATKSGNQTGIDFTATPALTWDTNLYIDDATWHSISSATSKMVVPAGVSRVEMKVCVNVAALNANEPVSLYLKKNGTVIASQTVMVSTTTPTLAVSADSDCVPTDYFEAAIYANDASANIQALGSNFSIKSI